jgi:hypothetical protein
MWVSVVSFAMHVNPVLMGPQVPHFIDFITVLQAHYQLFGCVNSRNKKTLNYIITLFPVIKIIVKSSKLRILKCIYTLKQDLERGRGAEEISPPWQNLL